MEISVIGMSVDVIYLLIHRSKMAGDTGVDSSQFKGLAKHFNSTTLTGRANVSGGIMMWFVAVHYFLSILIREPSSKYIYGNEYFIIIIYLFIFYLQDQSSPYVKPLD